MYHFKPGFTPFLILLMLPMLLLSCGTSRNTAGSDAEKVEIKNGRKESATKTYTALSEYFRRIPGLRVIGDDTNGRVYVFSGSQALMTTNEPLFVVDGVRIGQSFQALVRTLNVNDIERVSVLKTASETSIYGMAGSNGVIVIQTKRQ
ncbi:MAG: TonB-dependent receptor plug domain-containing protein [Phaeodactylibacter sp.]|nr:TonB-dependent receptor plug domain-containing protein [Phaeodactylibacter sp.]